MNKTRFDILGGHPLMLNNFEFMQDATREAIFQILEACRGSAPGFILTGLNFSTPNASTINWTSGYIYTQGEFFFVPAGQVVVTNTTTARLRANIALVYPSNLNPVIYANGSSQNVHEARQRQITVISTTAGPDFSDPRSWDRLGNNIVFSTVSAYRLAIYIDIPALVSRIQQSDIVHYVGNTTTGLGTTFLNLWANVGSGSPGLSFTRTASNQIVLQGTIARGNQSTLAGHIFTLPAGYRPIGRVILPVLQFVANNFSNPATWQQQNMAMVQIEPTGEVIARGTVNGGLVIHSFDGVSFIRGN
jgi:hypothetical protein